MENRFFEMCEYLEEVACAPEDKKIASGSFNGLASSQSFDWSKSMTVQNRVLVVLIENGGVDLGIPDLINKLLSVLKIGYLPDAAKDALVSYVRKKIISFTDNLIETAELTINRYNAAKPDLFGNVIILRNGTATYQELKDTLIKLSKDKKVIDIFVLTHGSGDYIALSNGVGIDGQKIKDIKAANGEPLSIRSVYMMNCVGSSLNKAWIDAGAKVSSGAIRNNYLPEPTMFFFWSNWKAGQNFETAVTGAYRKTINLMNEAVRSALASIPLASSYASLVNFENFDFVKDSAPVIQGQRSLTISSDDLTFTQSLYNSLATTVLPVSVLESMSLYSSSFEADKNKKPWTLSGAGVDLIKKFEGFSAKLYNDPVGHCTVGYGTLVHEGGCNGAPSEQPYLNGVTEQQATALLTDRAAQFQKTINDNVSVELTQNQFDALVSFTYNIGSGNFKQSTLLKVLNQGNYDAVPGEMKRWTKGRVNGKLVDLQGLVARRNAEAALFGGAPASVSQSLFYDYKGISYQFSGVNYTVPGIVPEIKQPSGLTCWAAVMTSMICWKRQQSYAIRDALATLGDKYVKMFDAGKVLDVNTAKQLYADAGLETIISSNYTIDGWEGLLKQFGPLYVDIGYPGVNNTHAIIVTAIKGGGNADDTNISYIDPGQGKTVTTTFKTFLANYEAPSAVNSWPYVIVHWPAGIYSGSKSVDEYSRPFYDTGEHAILGQFINSAVSGPIASVNALQPTTTFSINGVPFTYGQIITMGDFYNTYADFAKAPAAELTRLKALVVRSETHYKNSILGIGPGAKDPGTADWKSPTTGIGNRYLDLALKNNSHFAPPPAGTSSSKANNKQSWEMYHAQAIAKARSGTSSADLDAAYPINAFGDHFLTDAFSAGHLINKELVMNKFISNVITGSSVNSAGEKLFDQVADGALAIPSVKAKLAKYEVTETHWYIGFKHFNLDTTTPSIFNRVLKAVMEDTAHGGREQIANLAAKAIHDYLNNYSNGGVKGVPVRNNKGMSWNLSGDGTLSWDKSNHANNLEIIQLAVKQSVENLEDAVRNMSTPVSVLQQKVWDYVPILTDPATKKVVDYAISEFTNPASPLLIKKAISLIEEEIDTLLDALLTAKKIRSINTSWWG